MFLAIDHLFVAGETTKSAGEKGVNPQHCKPKTITRTRTVTKFPTTGARTTILPATTLASKAVTVIKSVKVTITKKVTVTKDALKTVTMSQAKPSARVDQKIVQVSGFLGDGGVCDLKTGMPKNDSDAGYNILLSKGDLMGNTCSSIQLSLIPGGPLTKATVHLECLGPAAWLKLISFNDWSDKCTGKALHGWVFPNGYNCSARNPSVELPFEISLSANACGQTATRVKRALPKLEFASVFNVWNSTSRGINNRSNLDAASAHPSYFLSYGVQVMSIDETGSLSQAVMQVALDLVEEVSSLGQHWGRPPKFLGTTMAETIQGVASFGDDLAIPTSGVFRLRACAQGFECAYSLPIEIVPDGVSKMVLLNQPVEGSKQTLLDPKTRLSRLTSLINVTMSDPLDNMAAQASLLGKGNFDVQVYCTLRSVEKLVSTEPNLWADNGYAEIWSFGDLKNNLDVAFGPGSVSGSLEGFFCRAEINIGEAWQDLVKVDNLKTNSFHFQ